MLQKRQNVKWFSKGKYPYFQLQTAVIRMSDNDVRSIVKDLIELFIDAGIHLDAVNCDGLKASQVCVQSRYSSSHKTHLLLA